MIYLIYFCIVMFATTVGSLSGMGGGVIIKPSLDALSFSNLNNINFYSSLAVLSMSAVSIYKKYIKGDRIDKKSIISIALGSIIGGIIGQKIFKKALIFFPTDDSVKLIQITITVIILSISVYYTLKSNYTLNLKNVMFIFFASLFLGVVSTFLGIGGGPINVSLFVFLFGISIKNATLFSITSIFFSQFSKNFIDFILIGISSYNTFPLFFIIPAAILGGNLGTKINISVSNKTVKKVYNIVTISVILLNIFNAIRIIIK